MTPLNGSGPVYAGRIITTGRTVQSILPVPPSPTWIPLPAVNELAVSHPGLTAHPALGPPRRRYAVAGSLLGGVSGVDRLRVDAEPARELLDDDV